MENRLDLICCGYDSEIVQIECGHCIHAECVIGMQSQCPKCDKFSNIISKINIRHDMKRDTERKERDTKRKEYKAYLVISECKLCHIDSNYRTTQLKCKHFFHERCLISKGWCLRCPTCSEQHFLIFDALLLIMITIWPLIMLSTIIIYNYE